MSNMTLSCRAICSTGFQTLKRATEMESRA